MLKVKAISLITDAFNETMFFDTLAEVKKSCKNVTWMNLEDIILMILKTIIN